MHCVCIKKMANKQLKKFIKFAQADKKKLYN